MQEEVGLKPGRLEPVHGFYVAPGWATEFLHGFLALECTPATLPHDADESVRVERYTLAQAMDLVERGEIRDAKSIVLLQAVALRATGGLGRKAIHAFRGD